MKWGSFEISIEALCLICGTVMLVVFLATMLVAGMIDKGILR